jgi:hypothetical protein
MSVEPEFAPDLPKVERLRFVPAAAFAAEPEEGSEPLAADAQGGAVIPAGGLVVVFGDGGAGKTTLVLDLVVHLATATPWLGLVTPTRPLRVGLVENESPRPLFRSKIARKLEAWPEAGERIFVLEEPWQGVTFRDPSQRDELVERVRELELDLLVGGPVARLGMQGGGTLEEVGDFAALVADVQRRAERPLTALLIHHENRAGTISGAWEGVPDSLVHVQAQGHGRTRVFWQKLRWASSLHGTTTHLFWAEHEGFEVEEREEITEATQAEEIRAAVREAPGATWTQTRNRVHGRPEDAARVRDRMLEDGELVNTSTRKGGFSLWAADDPVFRSEAGTEPERFTFPTPEREAADASVPPFRRSIGTEGTERNGRPGPSALDEELRLAASTTPEAA